MYNFTRVFIDVTFLSFSCTLQIRNVTRHKILAHAPPYEDKQWKAWKMEENNIHLE